MLSGKIALITGGSRGIGRQCALTLAGYHAEVIINYNGSEEKALETVEEIRKIARENKDWAKSDELRDLISQKGYNVKDTKNGVEVNKI